MTNEYQCDAVIVGGGVAGITAAIELLDANQQVILLDRDTEANFGGLAKESFGGMFMVNTPEQRRTGIKDSPELALHDWLHFAEFDPEDKWPRAWAECYVHESLEMIYHWLKDRGVRFFPVVHWVERGLYTPGNSVPRFHMVWGTGHGLITALIDHLISHPNVQNLRCLFEHRVDDVLLKGGRVVGCVGLDETHCQQFQILADNTVVATGGINGCLEKVRQHWDSEWQSAPETILNGSHHYSDGRLHEAVSHHGARVTHLDRQWNYAAGVHHPRPKRDNHGLSLVPCPSALWVNALGERIGPEPMVTGFDTRRLVTQVCQQPGQFSWQILNKKIAIKELAVSGSEFNDAIKNKDLLAFLKMAVMGNESLVDDLTRHCSDFVMADSLEELVEKINQQNQGFSMDLSTLNDELQTYDQMIDRGKTYLNDDQLRRIAQLRHYRGNRLRTCKYQKILDPKAGPLIAIREFILSRKSLGGLQTNLKSQVLNHQGEVIPGLYAAGEASGFGGGGIHGKRTLEGTFLGGCILTARKSAQAIVNG
ncbi:FAD-binding dehydrogenase [Litoribrevibacter albus]|uniref:Fumarate reductase/succinate dehydrogenase n=1 Tax=Litoribrevibacter albus TaxID=1473156 RepID=A0AA37S897_9GAMM|nr:FAD-binding dehydrogenase [Litoribrevibacter albus]GLQ30144.1 putative fumarate reductase/succinate dehydrogenase [Litoribrevibacter albus]